MSSNEGDKLYRVKTKENAHINEKIKEDGSRAAIQFDEENGLQGPVDLVEVDESEYPREVYIEVERKERSIKEILLEDVIAPAMAEALNNLMERAIDKGVDVFNTKVIPVAKVKCSEFVDKAKTFVAKAPATVQKTPKKGKKEQQQVYHSQEEAEQIVNNMKFAALYIAAGIRELSKTIIIDADNPEKTAEIESKFKELSSEQVMNTINFMLEEENRDQLDQVTLQLFEAFRKKEFIVDGEAIPINKVLYNQPDL